MQEVMADPVLCADGHTYERAAIAAWLAAHGASPHDGASLANRELTPNHALRNLLQAVRQQP